MPSGDDLLRLELLRGDLPVSANTGAASNLVSASIFTSPLAAEEFGPFTSETLTQTGGFVSSALGYEGRAANLVNAWTMTLGAAFASRGPTLSGATLNFNGTNQALVQWPRITPALAYALPDGLGSDAGRGATGTGLAFDASDGTFWLGNHGVNVESNNGRVANQTSVLHLRLNLDGSVTKLGELVLAGAPGGPPMTVNNTLQGVAVDNSDHTLWLADQDGYIYHMSVTGLILGRIKPQAAPNGLAYDSKRDALIYNSTVHNPAIIYTISKIDAHVMSSLSVRSVTVDHIFFDAERDWTVVTYGPNNSSGDPYQSGRIDAFDSDPSSLSYRLKTLGLTSDALPAIEGFALDATGRAYVVDDAYHHRVGPQTNSIERFDLLLAPQSMLGAHFDLGFTGWVDGVRAGLGALVSWDNPAEGAGVGLFVPGGTTSTLRVLTNTGEGAVTNDFVGVDLLTRHSYDVLEDLQARIAALFVDGVLFGTQPLLVTGSAIGAGELQVAAVARDTSGALGNFSPLHLEAVVAESNAQFSVTPENLAPADIHRIIGGVGAQTLTGTAALDRFVYFSAADSPVGAPDTLQGLGESDKIDLFRTGSATVAMLVNGSHTLVGFAPDVAGNYQGIIQVDAAIGGETLIAGGAPLTVFGGPDPSILVGTERADTIIGGNADDIIVGSFGIDDLRGNGGADRFVVNYGDSTPVAFDMIEDFQHGSDKLDILVGQLVGLYHDDFGATGTFWDYSSGSFHSAILAYGDVEGDDFINPTFAQFYIVGSGLAETLIGGRFFDAIQGGGGDDVLIGGASADALAGGAGADTFRYSSVFDSTPQAYDVIYDFQTRTDKIDLRSVAGGVVNLDYASSGETDIYYAPSGDVAGGAIHVVGDVEISDVLADAGTTFILTGSFYDSIHLDHDLFG